MTLYEAKSLINLSVLSIIISVTIVYVVPEGFKISKHLIKYTEL